MLDENTKLHYVFNNLRDKLKKIQFRSSREKYTISLLFLK